MDDEKWGGGSMSKWNVYQDPSKCGCDSQGRVRIISTEGSIILIKFLVSCESHVMMHEYIIK